MILFGLHGGIGNSLFCLPAIKALSRTDEVRLVVEGDYDMARMWGRCRYSTAVYEKADSPPPAKSFVGQYTPIQLRGRNPKFCGWPHGTSNYHHPEWAQVKFKAVGDYEKEDVSDWFEGEMPEKEVDFALIPCGKPGDEWSRKKWSGFYMAASCLEGEGYSVEAFGTQDDVRNAGLQGWWRGHYDLEKLPLRLLRCKVAISTDSGVGHLASSLGIPTIMLFTATSHVKGQPLGPHRLITRSLPCAPCQSTDRWKKCFDWECGRISADPVVEEAIDFLKKMY